MTLYIGIGNAMRRDDGVGAETVRLLAEQGLEAIEHAGDGMTLINLWQSRDGVVLIDAMRSGAAVGSLRRFDAHESEIPRDNFPHTSHVLGVAEAVEMARILGKLPPSLIVYGIEAADFGQGLGLTPEVARAVRGLADQLIAGQNSSTV
ncbi:hydrogenase maturation protease [Magnetospira sp. QH-2]|uniref:hydrogenase maturation protease n=1 Tax=Magnetospira sp. (strain QH-2) TaxID=1288970 RepID=UPI0003E8184F|nr:hydrogenase maturation protease [Magnetospira sp. QH-2]CCQ74986.1 putative hydrogenase maturation protease [Magnetospira sp. QH-2]